MTIIYADAREQDEGKAREALSPHNVVMVLGELLPDAVTEEMRGANILSLMAWTKADAKLLEALPELKFITTRSTGYDHIDLAECKRRGIAVANIPTYGENTVAEHTFALILALSRKLFQSYERTERMNFDREGLQGFDLRGRTLGIIGMGNIGKWVARIGVAFGMNVIAHDVHPSDDLAAKIGFSYASSFEDLLGRSHVITLHVPYIKATHHLINKKNISSIHKGAILVNTARGGVVETEALLEALDTGILAGAGLDVFEGEDDLFEDIALILNTPAHDKDLATLVRNHALIRRENVILTPHNAFNSEEAEERLFQTNIHNIKSFLTKDPVNLVG